MSEKMSVATKIVATTAAAFIAGVVAAAFAFGGDRMSIQKDLQHHRELIDNHELRISAQEKRTQQIMESLIRIEAAVGVDQGN
jgi:hypothetical protein